MAEKKYFYATGRRKTSTAKVRLYKGTGTVQINNSEGKKYIFLKNHYDKIFEPLKISGFNKKFDISVIVRGGGVSSQAEAIQLGVSKALLIVDQSLRTSLKKLGFLTRDPRMKERKKPGLKRARKSPQWSKR